MIVIEENFSLRSFNTFGLPAKTKIFAEASNVNDLQSLVDIFKSYPLPKLILGGGSNILFTEDFNGIIIYPDISGIEVINQDDNNIWVKAYAGENWDNFVSFCVLKNWGGIENLSLIPGKIGACPVQNIGAYGVEAKDFIHSVETLEIDTGRICNFKNSECKFGYRDSIFKHSAKDHFIVISVTFKLNKIPEIIITYQGLKEALIGLEQVNIQTIRDTIIKIRKIKLPDPGLFGNAGSFFKNPVISKEKFEVLHEKYPMITFYHDGSGNYKIAAASLIEKCGLKGKREGSTGTFDKQPLVIINYGDASGSEIYNFAKKIQQTVMDTFDICLDMEVNIY
jgi:UDP-N-acetylmuramate dehydrogenase